MIKLYNQYTDNIQTYGPGDTILFKGADMYVEKLSEADLNSIGLYYIEYNSIPNRRYYISTPSRSLVGNKYVIGYTQSDRPINEVRDAMLKDLKDTFVKLAERPVVDTGLGYSVDGGRTDLNNFEIGRELGFPSIKDVDGINHPATDADYATVILAIKQNGISLYEQKWNKEKEILDLPTIADCIAYENFEYPYTITQADVDADIDGTLTAGQIVTRTKNKVKDW